MRVCLWTARLAALRSGRVDLLGTAGDSQLRSIDQIKSLREKNPEINLWEFEFRSENATAFNNVNKPPFDDIRVRRAMQMAVDVDTIAETFFSGVADATPQGTFANSKMGVGTPFEEWPEEIKQYYRYDPQRAKQLMAEAGYPDGFKTTLHASGRRGSSYEELLANYWREIGVEVEIRTFDSTQGVALRRDNPGGLIGNIVDSGRTLPVIPANVTTESGQPYQRFRGKPSNFGWLPEWVVGMTGMDRCASASLIEQASGSRSSGEGEAMANERISMRKIRDIIRLREKGLGYRQIGRALRISHPVVSQYARDFTATGLSYAQIKGISDSELMELLAGGRTADARYGALGAWFERCARELKRVGVTIQQLWEEYRQEQPDGYSYSQFCYHFQVWRDGDEVTMHIEHKVGDKLFVDFAGKKLTVSEPHRGVRREVEVLRGGARGQPARLS